MDAVLGFFQTEKALSFRVELQYSQRQKAKRAVGECSRGMRRTVVVRDLERKQFAALISIHAHIEDIFIQLGEARGDLRVDLRFGLLRGEPRETLPIQAGQVPEGRRQVRAIDTELCRRRELI